MPVPDRQDLIDGLTALFDETGKAHHQAFIRQKGEDPRWASWYANYTHDRIEALLDIAIPESDLAALIEDIEERREREAPNARWPRFYAEFFADRFTDEG
jgi:putative heme degradation protein